MVLQAQTKSLLIWCFCRSIRRASVFDHGYPLTLTIAVNPRCAASFRGAQSSEFRAFGEAPTCKSWNTRGSTPYAAAMCKAVHPAPADDRAFARPLAGPQLEPWGRLGAPTCMGLGMWQESAMSAFGVGEA